MRWSWPIVASLLAACDATRAPARDVPPSPPTAAANEAATGTRAAETQGLPAPRAGGDRVGQPAPAWGELEWIRSEPLALEDLRGKVVLVRFWTDTCPFCRASAPALRALDEEYRDRGLVVIGMYHPKPHGTVRAAADVERVSDEWGWRFPVALDTDWATLRRFWLDSGRRRATSSSFLLDRTGTIRFVHPGPEFHPGGPADHGQCRRDHADLRAAIESLLAESSA